MCGFRVFSSVRVWLLPLAFVTGALIVGCGPYDHVGPAPTPTPVATATPVALPNLGAFSGSSTVILTPSATATTVAVALPAAGGLSGTLSLPVSGVPSSDSVTTTISSVADPAFLALAAARSSQSASRAALNANFSFLATVCVTSSSPLFTVPRFSLTFPAGILVSGSGLYLAIQYAPNTAYFGDYAGPATVVSATNATTVGSFALSFTTVPICFAMYVESNAIVPSPTPPPSPTPTPSPTPSPSPTATPSGAAGIGLH